LHHDITLPAGGDAHVRSTHFDGLVVVNLVVNAMLRFAYDMEVQVGPGVGLDVLTAPAAHHFFVYSCSRACVPCVLARVVAGAGL
jgi:hypothetical protein